MTRKASRSSELENSTLRDRAYRAMYAADQKFGHGSVPHRVAWTVFVELADIAAGNKTARAFTDNTERRLALDLVEDAARKRGKTISPVLEEMASRKQSM